LAKVYATNPANIERGIRHALYTLKSSERQNEAYKAIFGGVKREKLTNRRLIKIIVANYLNQ
jgi:hypothetical protein